MPNRIAEKSVMRLSTSNKGSHFYMSNKMTKPKIKSVALLIVPALKPPKTYARAVLCHRITILTFQNRNNLAKQLGIAELAKTVRQPLYCDRFRSFGPAIAPGLFISAEIISMVE
jgi:hypothetical protein